MTYPKYIRVDQDDWWGFAYNNGTYIAESSLSRLLEDHKIGRYDDGEDDMLKAFPVYTFPTAMFVVMED